MIHLKRYDFNRIIYKARILTYGLDTLNNINQNTGAGTDTRLPYTNYKVVPAQPDGAP